MVVDDYLPTKDGKLLYIQSASNDEFWSALLEKAYAKLYGSYEALKGGSTCEAMVDFSGGCGEGYDLKAIQNEPSEFFSMMLQNYRRSAMMACFITADPDNTEGVIIRLNLVYILQMKTILYNISRSWFCWYSLNIKINHI